MNKINYQDLENLAIGCTLLGSGGGGNPSSELLMAKQALGKEGSFSLKDVATLTSEDFVLPVAFMGAPLVNLEKLPSGRELMSLLGIVEKTMGRRPTVVMPVEIGGANGFSPIFVSVKSGLPVLDGDLMGRAFPELQMTSCSVVGLTSSPAFLADSLGNTVRIDASNPKKLEEIARHVAVSMGSSCAIAFALMNGEEAKKAVIPATMTQAIKIGRAITAARREGSDPVQTVINLLNGSLLGCGIVSSIEQSIQGGFLQGNIILKGDSGEYKISYQNEYLLAEKDGLSIASTPDILMLMESESGTPLTSETLRYGLKASLVAIPAPKIWTTERGLQLVGPQCFGYKHKYTTIVRKP